MDSAESGACGACDSVRGERQPRRAKNQSWDQRWDQRSNQRSDKRSDQSSDQHSVPRPRFLQRWRCWAPPPQHRWRRGGFEQRDRRRSNRSSIRSSSVRHSYSGGHKSGRRKQVAKNASSPSQARHDFAETTKMHSFASPAARVLRSVRSRWQTGWRSACARCRSPAKWSSANDHPLSNLYHGRIGLSSASRSGDSNQPDAAPCRRDGFFS